MNGATFTPVPGTAQGPTQATTPPGALMALMAAGFMKSRQAKKQREEAAEQARIVALGPSMMKYGWRPPEMEGVPKPVDWDARKNRMLTLKAQEETRAAIGKENRAQQSHDTSRLWAEGDPGATIEYDGIIADKPLGPEPPPEKTLFQKMLDSATKKFSPPPAGEPDTGNASPEELQGYTQQLVGLYEAGNVEQYRAILNDLINSGKVTKTEANNFNKSMESEATVQQPGRTFDDALEEMRR